MSLLIKGITRISELDIDADKDMTVHGLFNLKEVVASMVRGDIAVKDTSQLVIVAAGPADFVLTSTGQGKLPVWAPAGGGLKYYFPEVIGLTDAEAIVAAAQQYNKNALITSAHVQVYVDTPAQNVKRLDKTIVSTDAEAIVAAAAFYNKNSRVGRDIAILVDGAVSETAAGVQTDETAAARDPTTLNDMHLCPMSGHPLGLGDKYYLGFSLPFRRIYVYTSTAGAGNWTNQTYYWSSVGPGWTLVAAEDDQTAQFMIAATRRQDWTMPGDWIQSIVFGIGPLYWIKIETTTYVNQGTKPLGAAAWACPIA